MKILSFPEADILTNACDESAKQDVMRCRACSVCVMMVASSA